MEARHSGHQLWLWYESRDEQQPDLALLVLQVHSSMVSSHNAVPTYIFSFLLSMCKL